MNDYFTGKIEHMFDFSTTFILNQLNDGVRILIQDGDFSEEEIEAFGYTDGFTINDLSEDFIQKVANVFIANLEVGEVNENDNMFNDSRSDMLSSLAIEALEIIEK